MTPWLPLMVLLTFTACSTPRQTAQQQDAVRRQAMAGAFDAAAHQVNEIYDSHRAGEPAAPDGKLQGETDIREKHAVVWFLERGALAFLERQWQQALWFLDRASRMIIQERSLRMGDVVGESLVNESVGTYRGTGYENVYAEVLRSLSWLMRAQEVAGVVAAGQGEEPVGDALQFYDNAVNIARGLTQTVLPWIEDRNQDSIRLTYRYTDDPFARWLAAAVAMAHPQPQESDRQYAVAMFAAAERAFAQLRRTLASADQRHALDDIPQAFRMLHVRALQAYDPARAERLRVRFGFGPEVLEPPAGSGSLLVVNAVGFASRKQVMDVRLVAGPTVALRSSASERKAGRTVERLRVGNLYFWTKGPAGRDLDFFLHVPLPAKITDAFARQGTVLGFALPVFGQDLREASPASIRAVPVGADTEPVAVTTTEPAIDLDAIVRMSHADEQTSRVAAILTRMVAKQIAAQTTANEVQKESGELAGLFTRLLLTGGATLMEIADTRGWTLLPARFDVALLDLPAGTYQLQVIEAGGSRSVSTVTIAPDGLAILPVHTIPPHQPVR